MTKFYLKWRVDPTLFPTKPEEIFKLACSLCAMTKADLKAGVLKDWGCAPSGQSGYCICEGSETQLASVLQKFVPYILFEETTPVLSIDQFLDSVNKAVAAAKKK